MKQNKLFLLGVSSILASAVSVSAYTAVSANPFSAKTRAVVAQSQRVAVSSGTFLAAEKPTTGTARIITENGHRYLELDGAFSTSNQGPDLHVLLTPANKPPQSYTNANSDSYVNLGKLQKFQGAQRYPIPNSINLSNFKSVSVWCRMANATFGYAPLRSTGTASAQ